MDESGNEGRAVGCAAEQRGRVGVDAAEQVAMRLAAQRGRVTRKTLMEEAGIVKTKAIRVLRGLADKGFLVWVGENQMDPRQYYRLSDGD